MQPGLADNAGRAMDAYGGGQIDPVRHGPDCRAETGTWQREMHGMEYEITCDCGWSFRGPEDEVVAATIAHGKSVHQIDLTREQARDAARPIEPSPDGGD